MTAASARKACIIGHPIAHSRSPLIHGHWLRELGLSGAYERVDVPPAELASFLRDLARHGFVGANVTKPHKEAALRLAPKVSDSARAIGAVNTLWLEAGTLHADNTDVSGFLAQLDAEAPDWTRRTRRAVVLGAGGAARAVVHALVSRGVPKLTITNRDASRAQTLAGGRPGITVAPWAERSLASAGADLLVNATSLGMHGQPDLDIDLKGLAPPAIVMDGVYVPLETSLLAQARARGLACVDGLGMLLHQAVPGFAHWFGTKPEVTPALRAVVVADIMASR